MAGGFVCLHIFCACVCDVFVYERMRVCVREHVYAWISEVWAQQVIPHLAAGTLEFDK